MKFFVRGLPIPQGSMRAFNNHIVHSNQKNLTEWRKSVATNAQSHHPVKLDNGVKVSCVFYLPKPRTVKRDEPTVPPDLDKLIRAILDALTDVCYKDDAQVVDVIAQKRYASDPMMIGVMIEIQES